SKVLLIAEMNGSNAGKLTRWNIGPRESVDGISPAGILMRCGEPIDSDQLAASTKALANRTERTPNCIGRIVRNCAAVEHDIERPLKGDFAREITRDDPTFHFG